MLCDRHPLLWLIVMESSSDQSLLDHIIRKGPLKERKVRPLVQQLARTLSLLHKHGVVHRSEYSPLLFPHQITSTPPQST